MTTVDGNAFRQVMAHFATGVAVVTAQGDEGARAATISALSSVSLDPTMFLICLNRQSATCRAIAASGRFGVSILASDQESTARFFARPGSAPDSTHGPGPDGDGALMTRDADGTIHVDRALARIAAEVVETLRGGTHEIFLARPLRVSVAENRQPLLYFRGAFALEGASDRAQTP